MRLEWLEDILAVAENGSLSEAAERRNLTQSAFSRRIQNIEDYVGVELFDRTRKPVQLRPTTADQREQIGRLVGDLRQLVTDLRRGDRTSGNRVIIASLHSLTTSLTPELVNGIQARIPEAFVRLRSANLDDCFGLILSRQADIALVYRVPGMEHPIEADYIESLVLGEDRLIPVFAVDKADALNSWFQSGELPFIGYPGDVFLGQVMDTVILPRIRSLARAVPKAETALTLAALELAKVGIGVAWVPLSLARPHIARGAIADLSASLASYSLDVTAVRISGSPGVTENAIWDHLAALSAD
ncbi:LysR family transcriptional regulator [Roseobacter sp. HKCCD9010]|uniref:LysR family transcriptional regulator n=1 Tax=unclassified Roseobacter TaxID=196798 RepID=UPI0014908B40|nr:MULTISPECIES: LysR family transcriptional regulator [unclassified Roseobacter]MBF9050779.1 LysR family transcriptional regulator [Rhodobacterales bacterium HKCCD4356]NNV11803.1 LysR family transcriptional regulator [Roseobacter sp. HKCCD7357]NNV17954.1 LysR family transcriptional regulator [Roseobacter sp. HKCCD8768]NNV26045.1 LysR family transcriptional regulator [Roseobacter sp. HKCCD8192]NNV31681.1 LysR family transcriptional regulator [Roseobacter sp. HKCCD9061]